MAITRRQRKKISLEHSLRLRSRAVPHIQPAKWPVHPPRQKRRQHARRLSLPEDPDCPEGRTGAEQPQAVENFKGSDLDSGSLLLGCEEAAGCDKAVTPRTEGEEVPGNVGDGECGPSLQNGRTSPQPLPPLPDLMHSETSEMAGTETHRLASATPHEAASQLAPTPRGAIETAVQNPEDVGVPQDGQWDHIAAHERRFCVEHEEDEWLLGCADRWMYPSDFHVSGAESALEAKLQRYESNPWDLKTHRLASRAECNGNLWSHIDTPIQQGKFRDEAIYLIRWKLCWTSQSNIDDMHWVQSSFEAHNERINRRRSVRVEQTASQRETKREAMMVVVNLEDWI